MLSVASLLNPAPSGPSIHNRLLPSPASSVSPTASLADEPVFLDRPMMPKHKMAKDAAVFTKGKVKGSVHFYPFERLDDASLREVQKYQVFPFGKIQDYCRHIPYNSGKKDFFEKTGRESFEVFQYVFKVPGDDSEYAVMWDYNVGLTTPAKMLNMNPGLKEITHSITGGSIMAQGYWMPFQCAKAVCATFCHHIAGALIPLFGPEFPSQCIPPEAPEHGRMIIDPATVIQSTTEAERYRRLFTNMMTSAANAVPKRERKIFKGVYDDHRHYPRHRVRRPYLHCDSPYVTDTDGEISPAPVRVLQDRFHYSIPPVAQHRVNSGWTPANAAHHYDAPPPSPWLSAVPRFTSNQPYHLCTPSQPSTQPHIRDGRYPRNHPQTVQAYPPTANHWRPKRSAEHIDTDCEYDGGESRTATGPSTAATSPLENKMMESAIGAEKNAALLLMNLSVRDAGAKRDGKDLGTTSETASPVDTAFPRVKRSRASSM
ncbi:hypothetical protein JX265_000288 [Neoarthrinium moseri]|uniref:HTH APSES-type domain-containing protein n=1 Tax=Neoarthrinium moseri TaxID=1658444 RepID=A0A9Q0AW41_9PEZI|nr:hypothetical protein JX265_000288 [Neoarthrinium moseri]